MPLYKEQGIVLRAIKLGEADKIVTILTQGSGKVRAVAKGIRRTRSRWGARLEPMVHVSLLLYRGRGSLDTVTQAEILHPFRRVRSDLGLIAAAEAMLEAVDAVAEEHERNVRLFLLLRQGLLALEARPGDPAAVAEGFLLKLLSLTGFQPSLSGCAVCGAPGPHGQFSAGQGGTVCGRCAEEGAGPVGAAAVAWLERLARADLASAGDLSPPDPVRREARAMLYGYAEYHLERRLRSLALLARPSGPFARRPQPVGAGVPGTG
ncbi:MAG TPA: DNA repair protein RecO [Actinomycetota bacterium]|nr:DNA repair protein RecO [Actinomycetota bacterium]